MDFKTISFEEFLGIREELSYLEHADDGLHETTCGFHPVLGFLVAVHGAGSLVTIAYQHGPQVAAFFGEAQAAA